MVRAVLGFAAMFARLALVRGCFAAAVLLSAAPLLGEARSESTGFVLVLEVATSAAALLGPVMLAAIWGACDEANAAESSALFGVTVSKQRWAVAGAGAALLLVTTVAVLTVGCALVLLTVDTSAPPQGPSRVVAAAIVMLATVVVVALWTPGVLLGRDRRGALAIALLTAVVYLVARVGVSGPLTLLRAAVPTTAITVIDNGQEGVARGLGFTAAVLLGLNLGMAVYRLMSRPLVSAPAVRRSGGGAARRLSTRWSKLLWLPICLLAGAVLPALFSRDLPLSLRPSLALARMNDEAPEQVTSQYFAALAIRSSTLAAQVSTGRPLAELGNSRAALLHNASRGAYALVSINGLDSAVVDAELGPQHVFVCLRHPADSWVVAAVSRDGCG